MSSPTPRVDVDESISLRLLVTDADAVALPVSLRYSADDPYAVTVAFQGEDVSVAWVFGRDLLAHGLQTETGVGDVKVWPVRDGDNAAVHIKLSSPDGQATLEAKSTDVQAFLDKTFTKVRAGDEAEHLDLDSALTALLNG